RTAPASCRSSTMPSTPSAAPTRRGRDPPSPAPASLVIMTPSTTPGRPRTTRMAAPAVAPPARLAERYAHEFAGSKDRYDRARGLFPAGVTHDLRYLEPFPVYIDRAAGAHKWDVD